LRPPARWRQFPSYLWKCPQNPPLAKASDAIVAPIIGSDTIILKDYGGIVPQTQPDDTGVERPRTRRVTRPDSEWTRTAAPPARWNTVNSAYSAEDRCRCVPSASHLDLREATVDEQFRSCDIARIVGRKKRHSLGDLLRSAKSPHWHGGKDYVLALLPDR
jgi:hypothetical protein